MGSLQVGYFDGTLRADYPAQVTPFAAPIRHRWAHGKIKGVHRAMVHTDGTFGILALCHIDYMLCPALHSLGVNFYGTHGAHLVTQGTIKAVLSKKTGGVLEKSIAFTIQLSTQRVHSG